LMLIAGRWGETATESRRASWLGTVEASASFFERVVRPPTFWYHRGFGNLAFPVVPTSAQDSAQSKPSASLRTFVAGADGKNLFVIRFPTDQESPADLASVRDTPAYQGVLWSLEKLPLLLIEQQRTEAWKYLSDWIPLVRRVRLYAELERPGSGRSDSFDFLTEDASGKVLHLGGRLATVDVESFRAFVDRALQAKDARSKQGDIGGVLLISKHFPAAVLEAYRSMLHRGFGNRLLGLDKSMGYDGFVRLTSRRGFHLLLVEERDGELQPLFVE